VRKRGENVRYNLFSKSDSVSLSIDKAPIPINNLRYDILLNDERLVIRDFETSFESGKVALKGDVFCDDNEPDVNIKFVLDRAVFPVMGKSLINLSGEGAILGNNLPYSVGGEIIVNRAQIVN